MQALNRTFSRTRCPRKRRLSEGSSLSEESVLNAHSVPEALHTAPGDVVIELSSSLLDFVMPGSLFSMAQRPCDRPREDV